MSIQTVIDAVADAVRVADGSGGGSTYLLIDPVLGDPLWERSEGRRERFPLPISASLIPRHLCPYIVRLGVPGRDPLVDSSVEQGVLELIGNAGGMRSVCAWVVTDHSPDSLAAGLARRATVMLNKTRRLFRFWDPRVVYLLCVFKTADKVGGLFWPATKWCWISPDGRVQVIKGAKSALIDDASSADGSIECLIDGEILMNFGYLNKALELTAFKGGAAEAEIVRIELKLRQAVAKWHLKGEYEKVMYALYCLLIGFDFEDNADVHTCMTEALDCKRSAIDALELFGDDFWSSIARV